VVEVRGAGLSGTYACGLRLADGRRVAAGMVDVNNGDGDWAHTVGVAVDQIRDASLATPSGITLATATLS
jgi:hypothetical protein